MLSVFRGEDRESDGPQRLELSCHLSAGVKLTGQQNLRGLIQNIARKVHLQGGVVREVRGLGIGLTLPERMRRNQQIHDIGE